MTTRSNTLRHEGEVYTQEETAGRCRYKVRPKLAERQGRCGPERRWEQVWGGGRGEGGNTRSEGADKTGRFSGNKTWLPSSPHYSGVRGRGGRRQGSGPRGTLRSPPTARLGSAGTPRPVPPSWPRLLSSSLPGHTARARPAGRLRVPPRPKPERSGLTRAPAEHAQYLRLLHVGPRRAEPVAVTWLGASAAVGSPAHPQSAGKKPSASLALPPSPPGT